MLLDMQFERSAAEARQHAARCAALLREAETLPSRRFYHRLYESWTQVANQLEMLEATEASRAMHFSWIDTRGESA